MECAASNESNSARQLQSSLAADPTCSRSHLWPIPLAADPTCSRSPLQPIPLAADPTCSRFHLQPIPLAADPTYWTAIAFALTPSGSPHSSVRYRLVVVDGVMWR